MSVKVAIVGASGYTGGELLRLIINHGDAELLGVYGKKSVGQPVAELHPNLEGIIDLTIEEADYGKISGEADLVFTATPHGVAMKFVPEILDGGAKVIDLSADYRLDDPKVYEEYYVPHESPDLESVYGLPELYRKEIKKADLVANPGCYPTAAILELAPLLKEKLIDLDHILIDAKSGTSGAGAKPSKKLHHPNCGENILAYNAATHRHAPEIDQELGKIAGEEIGTHFTPHLIPVVRGIFSTSHVFLRESSDEGKILDLYRGFYQDEPFVRVLEDLPQTGSVLGSNYCDIGIELDEGTGRLIIGAAIDNLVKGASGQAIQNMNMMLGLDEAEGLRGVGLWP
ncbi:N-acetyl-gamma-glutamyl-phosphate reductase [candidate division MSBL1 archaeon SCGC-AAA833F18]|uniref:N-acetyl-gamma-glutamyl-phosphate reductase n=2 Tax=candidate division MSBL1 TaxID=215777 RepID=A0A133VRM0_9EURY|nr:N-acetyl-gamma-glutamyl-phosphate reductase [candidate division MSBL1 archaeon SCGC-AAA261O19]KXB09094.1 N-acetyl-gamma-glutamyl-phosphate reductase [candidate division MSBL1 archaeon SCGC-AAA833F18]